MDTSGERGRGKGKRGVGAKRCKLLCIKLKKEVANHSSILAQRIPWTEEPGGLQSMGHKESNMTEVT